LAAKAPLSRRIKRPKTQEANTGKKNARGEKKRIKGRNVSKKNRIKEAGVCMGKSKRKTQEGKKKHPEGSRERDGETQEEKIITKPKKKQAEKALKWKGRNSLKTRNQERGERFKPNP